MVVTPERVMATEHMMATEQYMAIQYERQGLAIQCSRHACGRGNGGASAHLLYEKEFANARYDGESCKARGDSMARQNLP